MAAKMKSKRILILFILLISILFYLYPSLSQSDFDPGEGGGAFYCADGELASFVSSSGTCEGQWNCASLTISCGRQTVSCRKNDGSWCGTTRWDCGCCTSGEPCTSNSNCCSGTCDTFQEVCIEPAVARCGDGLVNQPTEECDRGAQNGPCPASCSDQCQDNNCPEPNNPPTCRITSPAPSSTQSANFPVTINYEDPAFDNNELSTCRYRVFSNNQPTRGWTSAGACSGALSRTLTPTITVGAASDCRNNGANTCRVECEASDGDETATSSRTFSIQLCSQSGQSCSSVACCSGLVCSSGTCNTPPTVTKVTPTTGTQNQVITLTATVTDAEGDRKQLRWSCNGGTTWKPSSGYNALDDFTETCTYTTTGPKTVIVQPRDSRGAVGNPFSYTIQINPPPNQPPTCAFNSPPPSSQQSSNFGVSITFTDPTTDSNALLACQYRVFSNNQPIMGWRSAGACSGSNSRTLTPIITVGPTQDCRDNGPNTCRVECLALDQANSQGTASRLFSIAYPVCGNNIREGTEACDLGANNGACPRTCSSTCTTNNCQVCGDGIIQAPEQCDDANGNNNDACKNDCTNNICGDSVIRTGVEQCDNGANNGACPRTCSSTTCQNNNCPICNNNNFCDSAIGESCTSCPSDCPPTCSTNQDCNDNNAETSDVCNNPATCTSSCSNICRDDDSDSFTDRACGGLDCNDNNPNIRPNAAEVCNNGIDDNCNNQIDEGCPGPQVCGDGIIQAPEQCDDGNANNNDACKNNCQNNICGDGFRNPATESCDNGALNSNTCPATCSLTCTNNICPPPPTCGNGVREPPEQCDLGDASHGNGNGACPKTCSAICTNNPCPPVCNNNNFCEFPPETCANCINDCPPTCSSNLDCNDNNPVTPDICNNPGTCSAVCTHICPDADGDGFTSSACGGLDCNDNNPNIHPGAPELCDGLDNNCNNQIDEGLPKQTYCEDKDQDGFGNPFSTKKSCAQPPGYISDCNDCNDNTIETKNCPQETPFCLDSDGDAIVDSCGTCGGTGAQGRWDDCNSICITNGQTGICDGIGRCDTTPGPLSSQKCNKKGFTSVSGDRLYSTTCQADDFLALNNPQKANNAIKRGANWVCNFCNSTPRLEGAACNLFANFYGTCDQELGCVVSCEKDDDCPFALPYCNSQGVCDLCTRSQDPDNLCKQKNEGTCNKKSGACVGTQANIILAELNPPFLRVGEKATLKVYVQNRGINTLAVSVRINNDQCKDNIVVDQISFPSVFTLAPKETRIAAFNIVTHINSPCQIKVELLKEVSS